MRVSLSGLRCRRYRARSDVPLLMRVSLRWTRTSSDFIVGTAGKIICVRLDWIIFFSSSTYMFAIRVEVNVARFASMKEIFRIDP